MGKRRTSRERALQILYETEFNDAGLEDLMKAYWAGQPAGEDVRPYAEWLVRGVAGRRDEIDAVLRRASAHWRVARMTAVDRNILRLAVFELTEQAKVLPPAVVIDEAIEIAKRFGGAESAEFVNGVLDAVRRALGLPESQRKANEHEQKQAPRTAAGSGAATKRPGGGPRRKP